MQPARHPDRDGGCRNNKPDWRSGFNWCAERNPASGADNSAGAEAETEATILPQALDASASYNPPVHITVGKRKMVSDDGGDSRPTSKARTAELPLRINPQVGDRSDSPPSSPVTHPEPCAGGFIFLQSSRYFLHKSLSGCFCHRSLDSCLVRLPRDSGLEDTPEDDAAGSPGAQTSPQAI